MTWGFRNCALAAAAATLLSAQAVYAAPAPASTSGIDPLVSLSVLGTDQSRAAVCSASNLASSCSVPTAMASASAMSAASMAAAAQVEPGTPKAIGVLPAVIGLAVLIAIIIAITSGGGSSSGNLTPVSPA